MATTTETIEVPSYVSDEENMDESIHDEHKKRATKKPRTWIKEKTFNNAGEAKHAITQEGGWSEFYSNTTAEGRKTIFRCNKVKLRGRQCDAGIYLLFNSVNEEVILFRGKSDHTHHLIQQNSTRIPNDVKMIIKEFYDLKLKPKAIIEALYERGITAPSIRQLNNFLRTLKTERFGSTQISLGEIEDWCIESSKLIPDSDNTGFVVSYEIIYDDDDNNTMDDDDNGNKFRFFVSTKRLLRIASMSKKIHADATYKLNWQGFPVLVIGTTDLDRHFHGLGIAVCSNEKTQDFTFVFQALQGGVKKLNLPEINPDTLIADGSDAIRNGFEAVFGEKYTVMCWAHMRRKVVKKIEAMVEKMDQEDLIEDVEALQLAQSEQIFTKASILFIKKWKKKQPTFVEYFENEWLASHNGWYEGIQHLTPSTNNALEATNRVIKDENTFRERLPLARFKVLTFEIVEKWSKLYERNLKQFYDKPTVTLDIWTKSYQWVKLNKSIISNKLDNVIECYVPAGEELNISKNAIDIMKKMKWYSFDQYKIKAFNIWRVILPTDGTKWLDSQCNCPGFLKKFICKHIVGLAIRLNYCKPPPAAKNVKIGEKRRRGRPSKAKKALLIQ